MATVRFRAKVDGIGRCAIVRLPEDASAKMPSRGQVAVKGVMNRREFQAVLEPDGRRGHWLKVDNELRKAVGAEVGETVMLEVEPTKLWPEPDMPDDLVAALASAPDIHELWTEITSMARWEWVRWINATKNAETRERRVEVSISKLRSGKRRPCCFDLSACTDQELSRNGKLIEPL
jgi:hypothetical protein